VRAEDGTSGNSGPNGGNETPDTARRKFTATGTGQVAGTFFDGADARSLLRLQPNWSITNSQAANGALSYRNATHGNSVYDPSSCISITSPPIILQAGSPVLSYRARFEVEQFWDGVVNEISTDGGVNWTDLPPDGGYPTMLRVTAGNGCGLPNTRGVYSGSSGGIFQNKTSNLGSFAGQTVQLRWRFTSDGSVEEEGFYLDDVQVTDASTPASCRVTALFKDGFDG
jgi:Immune inhibitor A peptidase M6